MKLKIVTAAIVYSFGLAYPAFPSPTIVKSTGNVEVAFNPNNCATKTIIKAMSEAQHALFVQA